MTSNRYVDLAWTRQGLERERANVAPLPSPTRGSAPVPEIGPGRWWDNGLCARGQLYSDLPWLDPENADANVVHLMLAVCRMCPVFAECESDAADHQDRVGVRAGVLWTADGNVASIRTQAAKLQPRPCKRCFTTFTPARANRLHYCSQECATLARGRKLPIVKCGWCGGDFDRRVVKRRTYCSDRCAHLADRVSKNGRRSA